MKVFVSTAIGLEPLLAAELQRLGCSSPRPTRAGCEVEVSVEEMYRINLWSRVASRVLLPLATEAVEDGDELYAMALAMPWQDWLQQPSEVAIDFSGTNAAIRHTHFGALRFKDGLVDWCRENDWPTPQLSGEAGCRISVRLRKGRAEVALDLSGEGLHKRGFRREAGAAPLRESLAAALLYYAGWSDGPDAERFANTLLDPMCGSGTLVLEAAAMAIDRAPGISREAWGFQHWSGHSEPLWQAQRQAALARETAGRANWQGHIYGSDSDTRTIQLARRNLSAAGLDGLIQLEPCDVRDLQAPAPHGLLITNPPYGERLQDHASALKTYSLLGEVLRDRFVGWQAAVLATESAMGQAVGMHSHRSLSFLNGNLECKLYLFQIAPDAFLRSPGQTAPSEGARMVANRISKNTARLKSWRKQNAVAAWRCYDRDLSEYAAAVDIYEAQAATYALVQEYAPPKTVDAALARHRLNEIVTGVGLATGIPAENILLRRRERQRGQQQYEKQEAERQRECIVTEAGAPLVINLTDYLDTGLFLDHRPVRRFIRKQAKGKRFLNLFCYTASATVMAALGGARESLSLDMSNTYLGWAQRNFELNRLDLGTHRLQREDCLQWLREPHQQRFDLILLDPPSFSNSKRMEEVLDVERDQEELVRGAMQVLDAGGVLVFSTNRRGFKLADSLRQDFAVEDYQQQSIDPDFERHPGIHSCWLIRHVTA